MAPVKGSTPYRALSPHIPTPSSCVADRFNMISVTSSFHLIYFSSMRLVFRESLFFGGFSFFFFFFFFFFVLLFCFFHSALFRYLEMAKFYDRPFLSIAVFIFSANLRSLLGYLVDLEPSYPHCLKITGDTQKIVKSRSTALPRHQKKER